MARVAAIGWDAEQADQGARRLQALGHEAVGVVARGPAELLELAARPPDAAVIDLSRRPSQGRDVGVWLRQRKATRSVRLVFVGGEPEKVAPVRRLLPDATYATWDSIREALGSALARPANTPLVPDSMAPYRGAPLSRRLGVAPGARVVLLGAPEGFETGLAPLPEGVRVTRRCSSAPVVMLFVGTPVALRQRFPAAARAVAASGRLWIAWRKGGSARTGDLTQPVVRVFGMSRGWVDYKVCAIDAIWTGLCFARRPVNEGDP